MPTLWGEGLDLIGPRCSPPARWGRCSPAAAGCNEIEMNAREQEPPPAQARTKPKKLPESAFLTRSLVSGSPVSGIFGSHCHIVEEVRVRCSGIEEVGGIIAKLLDLREPRECPTFFCAEKPKSRRGEWTRCRAFTATCWVISLGSGVDEHLGNGQDTCPWAAMDARQSLEGSSCRHGRKVRSIFCFLPLPLGSPSSIISFLCMPPCPTPSPLENSLLCFCSARKYSANT